MKLGPLTEAEILEDRALLTEALLVYVDRRIAEDGHSALLFAPRPDQHKIVKSSYSPHHRKYVDRCAAWCVARQLLESIDDD